jgi:hypothetical protein
LRTIDVSQILGGDEGDTLLIAIINKHVKMSLTIGLLSRHDLSVGGSQIETRRIFSFPII